MIQQPIYIIGAGLAGLTLGRCLKARGIPAIIFEKSASPASHEYGITIQQRTYQSLLKVLHMDMSSFQRRTAVDGSCGGVGNAFSHAVSLGIPRPTCSFRAHRGNLEDLLREGLEIRWNYTLQEVERTPEGLVTIFRNGHRFCTKLTVGTDGVHSTVRKLLIPMSQTMVLPYAVFRGKRYVQYAEFNEHYASYFHYANIIETLIHGVLLQISINERTKDGVSISYIYSRSARQPPGDDPLFKPSRPNNNATLIPEDFFKEVEGLDGLEPPFSSMFDVSRIRGERVLHWLMRSLVMTAADLVWLAVGCGVAMIGDAAHAMPILGGNGANAAIMDAIDLAEHLEKCGPDHMATFYKKKRSWKAGSPQSTHQQWDREVTESEEALAIMHYGGKSIL
ncbi:MAG: hypothetical protein M1827_006389 [Pycnora praestabilis]|nr:MAG: hypothetical protein M1827_006389 [Pycnora praestabilis]